MLFAKVDNNLQDGHIPQAKRTLKIALRCPSVNLSCARCLFNIAQGPKS